MPIKMRKIIILTLFLSLLQTTSFAEPIKPKERIPSDISPELKKNIEMLYSSDAATQQYAARKIGKMGKEAIPAIPFLIDISGVPEYEYTSSSSGIGSNMIFTWHYGFAFPGATARTVLMEMGDVAVEPLIKSFQDKSREYSSREGAILTLVSMKEYRAIEPLVSCFINPTETMAIRIESAKALDTFSWVGNKDIVSSLISFLKEKHKFGYPENMSEKSNYFVLKKYIINALGRIGDERAVEPLILVLTKEAWKGMADEDCCVAAMYALSPVDDEHVSDVLVKFINKAPPAFLQSRIAGAEILGARINREWNIKEVGALKLRLNDIDGPVRSKAISVFANLQDPRAVDTLVSYLNDRYFYIRQGAELALKKMTSRDFGQDQVKWQEWWDDKKKVFSAKGDFSE